MGTEKNIRTGDTVLVALRVVDADFHLDQRYIQVLDHNGQRRLVPRDQVVDVVPGEDPSHRTPTEWRSGDADPGPRVRLVTSPLTIPPYTFRRHGDHWYQEDPTPSVVPMTWTQLLDSVTYVVEVLDTPDATPATRERA